MLLLAAPLLAQEVGAPVILEDRVLFYIKAPLGAFTPQQRAVMIEEKFAQVAAAGARTVNIEETDLASLIRAGNEIVVNVNDADARAERRTRPELAREWGLILQRALEYYAEERRWDKIALAVLRVFLAWAIFIAFAFFSFRGARWLRLRVAKWHAERARKVRGLVAFFWDRVLDALVLLAKLVLIILGFILLSSSLTYSLGQFPATRAVSNTLVSSVKGVLESLGSSFLGYLPDLLILIIIAAVTNYLLGLLKVLARAIERKDFQIEGFYSDWAQPTYSLIRVLVIVLALVIAFPYVPGASSDAFKMISIFFGVLVSFGSSSTISSIISGVILTYMRPFRRGDWIQVGDVVGSVDEKTLLVTRLKTIKNVEVTIPNSTVLSSQVQNYSDIARTQGLILHTAVTIGYDAPWRTVHDLLLKAAAATENVLRDPAPFVWQTSLNDFNITYEINIYTDRPELMYHTYAALHANIQDCFNAGGVEIMSPNYFALRDGNTVTIPEADRPRGYQAPGFRLDNITRRPPRS